VKPSDLQGEARELYESWRDLGYSEVAALDLVQRSGLIGVNEHVRQVYEFFRGQGLSERAASHAALGRDAELPAVRGSKRNSHGTVDFDGQEVDSSIFKKPGGAR
jgi:hypothetical protein